MFAQSKDFTTLSIAFILLNSPDNWSRGSIEAPSDGAVSGFSWVSMNTPAIPTAVPAFAKVSMNSLEPPLSEPFPPGC